MSREERPGTITLRDVADRAGVSISTASRALTGTRRVHPDLIERVESAASELGYRPNEAARSLRMARTMTFGVIFNRLESPVMLDLLDGLNEGSSERDYTLLVTSARGDANVYRRLIQRLFERRVDGLLLSFPTDIGPELRAFHAAGTPVLALLSRGAGAEGIPVVTAAAGPAREATLRRLAALGHRRVALLGGNLTAGGDITTRAAAESGIALDVRRLSADTSGHAFAQVVAEAATPPHGATAFIVDYMWSSWLIGTLRELGLEVPRDASVVTFTDSRLTHGLVHPPMAAIDIDTHEIGRRAASLVADWIDGVEPPDVTALDVARFVERPSIGRAPGSAD